MQNQEFTSLAEKFFRECLEEMERKGADYSGRDLHEDTLGNFKGSAADAGIAPLQAWFVHWDKHVRAIKRFIRSGGQAGSESIAGRIKDNVAYSVLLLGLLVEQGHPQASDLASARSRIDGAPGCDTLVSGEQGCPKNSKKRSRRPSDRLLLARRP